MRQPSAARPRIVVVAQARPAMGGIPSFTETIVGDPVLAEEFDISLLNTTRQAVREAGTLTPANAWHALVDAARTLRAARRAEVVHLQTAPGRPFPLLRALAMCAAARAGGARVLCHVHSARINGGRPDGFAPGPVSRWLLRRLAFVDAVLTVARAGTATLRRYLPQTARIETVDNAIDVASFDRSPLDGEPPTLLFVGTLSRRKGVLDLVAALEALRRRGVTAWRLEVVGGANEVGEAEAQELRRALCDAGLEASLLGAMPAAGVKERLRRADVFVLPSHFEGQPIAILEAMASGLPVVATRVGAVPDVVVHEADGLLVEPHQPEALADALEKLVASSDLRRRYGASARARAEEHHDLSVLRRHLSRLYREA